MMNEVIEVEWFSALLSGFLVCQSTNIQAPNTRETPNLNLQYRQWRTLPPGKQAVRPDDADLSRITLEIWSLVVLWGLDVGAWCFDNGEPSETLSRHMIRG
jgi:hypothetical protein